MKSIKTLLFLLIIGIYTTNAQVLISDGTGDTDPDASAMLEIRSTSGGVLIPRMSTGDRNLISSPKAGLLVFDETLKSFFMYGAKGWVNLSTSAGIWETNASDVYLSSSYTNVGIGTSSPSSKFVVQADAGADEDAALFEVKDETVYLY